jgi:myosin-1
MYRAKYAFEGQAGELSLVKDGLVELVEKDDNGWWLVKKGAEEGWAPSNYLELVPPKPKAAPAPPPPPPPRPPAPPAAPVVALKPKPAVTPTQQPKIQVQSLIANSSAKPVSVFPGLAPPNGTAAPWKKSPVVSAGTTPMNSRPPSTGKPAPPALPTGKKPAPPPPVAPKPTAPKLPGRPPVPTATRPPPAPTAPRPGAAKPSGAAPGQMDLAAAVGFLSTASVI